MIIGQIDYLNLLPFTLFIKQYKNDKFFKIMQHHKSYPTQINQLFASKKIQAGFLSSLVSKKYNRLDMGIIAYKKVFSVLICDGDEKADIESSSSNMLAKILDVKGKVLIGDKALKVYYNHNIEFRDLATLWYEKYNLPFVFAVFCVNKDYLFYKKLAKQFLKTKINIPQYILNKYSKTTNISKHNISSYLSNIHYKIGRKEKKALKKFFDLSKQIK